MNSKVLASPKLIRESEIFEARRTMAMLTKLFPTRIEASSCSGSERSFSISCAERFLFDLSESISFGSSENKATSDPEIIAESARKIINTKSPDRTLNVKGKNSMFPNKASTDVKKFVSKFNRLVIKMGGHRECSPAPNILMKPEVH